jgi:hypothetical protein
MNEQFRRIPTVLAAGALTVFSLSFPAATAGQQTEDFTLSGDQVAIYNIAGNVTIEDGGGSAVLVEVRRLGSDAANLRVETGLLDVEQFRGQAQTLRVIYPEDRVIYRGESRGSSELRVAEDGTFYNDRARRGRKLRVRDEGSGMEAHADLRIRVPSGKRVMLALALGQVEVTNVDGDLWVNVGSANITTHNTSGYLDLDTGSGNIEVDGAQGDVNFDTGSGNVHASNVDGTEINIDTGSGNVTGGNLKTSELGVDTGSGNVRLNAVTARDVSVDTGSGNVDLELLSSVERIEVDTGSGDVTLAIPSGFGGAVEIETGSGGITTDLPIEMREFGDDYVRGRIGDGNGRIVVDTGSGSIALRKS